MANSDIELQHPPIFIVGPVRSGSTLLRVLLDHHSLLNICSEFEGAVSQAIGDDWPDIEQYRHFVKHDRQMKALNVELDESLGYEALVHYFLCQMNDRSDKPFIGTSVHSRIDLLPKLWPEAIFIHILRDPRDVARSAIGMGWVGNVHEGIKYWIDAEIRWDRLCAQVPESQRLEIRYEELVEAPSKYLAQVCDFLKVEYEPGMLDIENDSTYSSPDPAYSYQWKQKLNPKEIVWVEYQCKELLLKRGYAFSGHPLGRPTVLQLLGIRLQSRYYRLTFNIKHWGIGLWLKHVIAKRVGTESWKIKIQKQIDVITIKNLK